MSIKTVTTDDLRRMNGKEGLVLQGCGGDPQEWLDGINELLTDEIYFAGFSVRPNRRFPDLALRMLGKAKGLA